MSILINLTKVTISEILQHKSGKPGLSIEIFPPKTPKGTDNLILKLREYARFDPDFISVTYGAGGSSRDGTLQLARFIQKDLNISAMAHLTCVNQTQEEISQILDRLHSDGIQNIMALRGDPPLGKKEFEKTVGGFGYANELIEFIQTRNTGQNQKFGIGCAGYPEGHVESASLNADLDRLKQKVESGARFIVTQFFLDNSYFYRFREKAAARGIQVPILAGILPIANYSQITKFSIMCGCTIPARVMRGLHGRSDEDQEKFGLDHAQWQVEDLLKNEVNGIHLYALNKKKTVERLAPLVRTN